MQFPSSSTKFVNMTCEALVSFEEEHNVKFAKVTKIPLEGDGTISRKVEKCVTLFSCDWPDLIAFHDAQGLPTSVIFRGVGQ